MSEVTEKAETPATDLEEYLRLVRKYGKITSLELLRTIDALYTFAAKEDRAWVLAYSCTECGAIFANSRAVQICPKHAALLAHCADLRRSALEVAREKGCNGKINPVEQEGEGALGGIGQAQELREETQVRE